MTTTILDSIFRLLPSLYNALLDLFAFVAWMLAYGWQTGFARYWHEVIK